jgi:eukaryotic-like serine/threonine-protein kinase
MAYRTGAGSNVQPAWLDRNGGGMQPVGEPGRIFSLSLSPDESQVALLRSDSNAAPATITGDIWLLDLKRDLQQRLTTGQSVQVLPASGPTWSPDGKQLAYGFGTKLYVKDVGGAADAKLIKDVGKPAVVTDWTRDGFLIYTALPPSVFSIPVQGGDPAPLGAPEGTSLEGVASPDGHWIAYASTRSGRAEVYVRPFTPPGAGPPPAGPVIQVSAGGGSYPKWRADGRELFFLSAADGSIMAAAIETANGVFRPAAPVPLKIAVGPLGGWSPDHTGQKFLLTRPLDQGVKTAITVVTNWEATLKR